MRYQVCKPCWDEMMEHINAALARQAEMHGAVQSPPPRELTR